MLCTSRSGHSTQSRENKFKPVSDSQKEPISSFQMKFCVCGRRSDRVQLIPHICN